MEGDATFELEGDDTSSNVRVEWDLEIKDPLVRPVIVIARPVLVRAQLWAVEVALRGFRRYLSREGYS